MKRLLLITICSVLVSLGACVQKPRPNILVQSPDEILNTMRLLMHLKGGTRVRDYEDILGGKFVLTKNMTDDGFRPFQIYTLDGPSGGIVVTMEIDALFKDANLGKQVVVGLVHVNQMICITKGYSEKYLSKNLYRIGEFPYGNHTVSYHTGPDSGWPVLNISYSGRDDSGCVQSAAIGYGPTAESWGN